MKNPQVLFSAATPLARPTKLKRRDSIREGINGKEPAMNMWGLRSATGASRSKKPPGFYAYPTYSLRVLC